MSERMSIGDAEERRFKRKIEEVENTTNESSPPSKSLKLSEDDSSGSLPKPVVESSQEENKNKNNDVEFICKFCKKTFSNSQSLGGHQNAHKRERLLKNMEKERERNMNGFGSNNPYPYSLLAAMSNPSFRGVGTHLIQGGVGASHVHYPMSHVTNMSSSWPYTPSGYWPYGINQLGFSSLNTHCFGMPTSSWGGGLATTTPSRSLLNPTQNVGLFHGLKLNQFPSFSKMMTTAAATTTIATAAAGATAATTPSKSIFNALSLGGSSQGSGSVSTNKDSSSEELDLSLRL